MARGVSFERFMPRNFGPSCMKFASSTASRVRLNDVSKHAFIHQTGVFSAFAFISPISSGTQRTIFGNNASAVTEKGAIFAITSGTNLRLQITDGASAVINVSTSGLVIVPSKWQAVGVSANGPGTAPIFFHWDGANFFQVNPGTNISGVGSGNCSFPMFIGTCNGASPASPFGGFMDEVSIHSVAATLADFKNFVLKGIRPSSGLKGYYKFDENGGSTQTDSDGYINGDSATTQYITNYLVSKARSAATVRSAALARSLSS